MLTAAQYSRARINDSVAINDKCTVSVSQFNNPFATNVLRSNSETVYSTASAADWRWQT
jgi:hypothetical protein